MLRQGEQIGTESGEGQAQDRAAGAMDALARQKAGARRTAWIVGGVAAAFFIASLVQGHFVHIPL